MYTPFRGVYESGWWHSAEHSRVTTLYPFLLICLTLILQLLYLNMVTISKSLLAQKYVSLTQHGCILESLRIEQNATVCLKCGWKVFQIFLLRFITTQI
jgi:hypothetical protein